MELEHIGIAVRDAASALRLMEALIGERPYKSETVDAEGVRTYFLRAGGAKLELLEALDEDSPIARHIEKRGQGLHHLAFEVDDLEEAQDRLTKAGFTVLGESRRGADGKHIFFLHPRDTGGILFEFCRQSRSILEDSNNSLAGPRGRIRRAGTKGSVCLIIGEIPIDVEALARRLEQSTRVVVVDELSDVSVFLDEHELEAVHLIAASSILSKCDRLDPRVLSSIVFANESADLFLRDRPMLVAARPSAAAAAVAMYERSPDSDLAIGSDDLLSRAIETHIRSFLAV